MERVRKRTQGGVSPRKGGCMKTVYRTSKYKVVKDDTRPTPQYHVYRDDDVVHTARSQVEATMWIGRQKKGR